jgi:polyhydroxyalkanoate synthesis regulator protein
VLTQIIFEQENKEGGQNLLRSISCISCPLLQRQHADDGAAISVSIDLLTREQTNSASDLDGVRHALRRDPGQVRRNMEMFERTFSMFAPFARQGQASETPADADNAAKPVAGGAAPGGDIDDLKRQIDEMQKRIERIGDKDK